MVNVVVVDDVAVVGWLRLEIDKTGFVAAFEKILEGKDGGFRL